MYLLDTNICSYIIKERPPQVIEKFRTFDIKQLKLSIITASELAYGVEKSGSVKNKLVLEKFLRPFEMLDFNHDCIWHYAQLRHFLQSSGNVIGSLDMLIAAHALANNATLVTNNVKEFERVPKLNLENWV